MRQIDADALRDYFHVKERCEDGCAYYNKDCGNIDITLRDVCEAIDEIQTIDAEPVKRGKWDDSYDGITPVCSVCGMSHRCFIRTPNYCPNCGAKMQEAEDE